MNCTCRQADSFNVRVSDLIDPKCPEHGCPGKQSKLKLVKPQELSEIILEHTLDVDYFGREVRMLTSSLAVDLIVSKLLGRFEIRRRQ